MKNRRPTPGYEGRVLITPETAAVAPFYATVTMADNPIEEGTPMAAETFLSNATANMLHLDDTATPDDALRMLAALATSGGSGTGDVGELEDLTIRIGSLTNAGAGWNTYMFPEPFDAPPVVLLQPVDFKGWVEVKQVTADGFLYCLQMLSTSGTTTTADSVKIHYMAVEYGGER